MAYQVILNELRAPAARGGVRNLLLLVVADGGIRERIGDASRCALSLRVQRAASEENARALQ